MPFVNDSIRNYAILHIVADEAKIFVTKERAPVLLHFEAFRPEELMLLSVKPERPLKTKRQKNPNLFKSTTEIEYENYRSSSWDSSKMSKKDLERLVENSQKRKGKDDASLENPSDHEQRNVLEHRRSIKSTK